MLSARLLISWKASCNAMCIPSVGVRANAQSCLRFRLQLLRRFKSNAWEGCPRLYINGNANYSIPGHMSGRVFEVLSTATQICMWSKYGNSLFIRTSTPGRPRRLPGRRGSDQRGKRGRRHRPHLLVHCLCGGRPRPRSRPAAPGPRPLLPR